MVVSLNSRLESNKEEEKNLRSLTEASAQLDGDGAPRVIDELQLDRTPAWPQDKRRNLPILYEKKIK